MNIKITDFTPSELLESLFDNGNYTEVGAYVTRLGGEPEGIACAYGPVGGRLVFAFAQNEERLGGALDTNSIKKLEKLYSLALNSRAPIVGVFASRGALVTEGAALLDTIGHFYALVEGASGLVPRLALIAGTCTGSSAVAASMFDLTVSVKGAELSVAPEFVSGGVNASEIGLSAIEAEDRAELFAKARALIEALPDNSESGVGFAERADLERPLGIHSFDKAADILSALSDSGEYIELYAARGKEIKTAFLPLAGGYVGVVASDYSENKGAITPAAAEKAGELISLCSDYSIPVITVINSDGFDLSADSERGGLARKLAALVKEYRWCDAPKVCAVVGRACGGAFPVLGQADVTFALESAVISPLTPEKAVAFLKNDEITPTVTRESLEALYAENEASPVHAARDGSVDFICSADELRQRICGALMMLCPDQ